MAIKYKILGQSQPTANVPTSIYTVPAGNSAVISTLNICNLSGITQNFSIAARPNGNTLASSQYLSYNTPVGASDSIALTIGIALSEGDVLTLNAPTGNIACTLFGSEIY